MHCFTGLSILSLIPNRKLWDRNTIMHAMEMTKQLILKYALAQGDMWIVSYACNSSDQGVYSVALNYGSLLCRLLLQPLEESGLQFFSRSISSGRPDQRQAALDHLSLVLRLDCILSLLFGLVAPWYTGLLVRTLLGAKWSGTSMAWILAWYCLQIPSMAFCGILEAFQNGTMTADWYSTTRHASILFSVTYTLLSVGLTRSIGTVGLIIAGMVSFSLRAILGLAYLQSFLGKDFNAFARRSIPSSKFVTTCIGVCVMSYSASNNLSAAILSAALIGASLFTFESDILSKLRKIA